MNTMILTDPSQLRILFCTWTSWRHQLAGILSSSTSRSAMSSTSGGATQGTRHASGTQLEAALQGRIWDPDGHQVKHQLAMCLCC